MVITIAFLVAGLYVAYALRGPNGIPAVLEKQRQVRQLQEQNANLQKQIEAKHKRIERLRSSRTQQEMEIRERLKLLKEKETTFILQEQAKPQPNQPLE
jgi:cell division protein FtsB